MRDVKAIVAEMERALVLSYPRIPSLGQFTPIAFWQDIFPELKRLWSVEQERDEARDALQEKDKLLLAATSERNHWQAEAQKWRRIRTPTHGTCCTCQGCGQSHKDCKCSEEELEDALNQVCNERDELREAVFRYREASDAYNQQHVDAHDIQLALAMMDARNALFAKARRAQIPVIEVGDLGNREEKKP